MSLDMTPDLREFTLLIGIQEIIKYTHIHTCAHMNTHRRFGQGAAKQVRVVRGGLLLYLSRQLERSFLVGRRVVAKVKKDGAAGGCGGSN